MTKSKDNKIEEENLANALSQYKATVTPNGNNFNVKLKNKNYIVMRNGDFRSYIYMKPTDIYWRYDDVTKILYLRSSNKDENGNTYTKGMNYDDYKANIKEVIIEEPIAPTTCRYMFYECTNLKKINNIENLHMENSTSMYYMFYNCKNLETLNVSNFETSKVNTMQCAFAHCESLQSLDLSNFNTQNVTILFRMFESMHNIDSLDLSGFNTKKVNNMAWMFLHCHNLKNVNFGNIDTSNVQKMNYMFGACYNLTSIDVSSFNTENVTEMDMMFNGCSALVNLDVSHFDVNKVNNMNAMYRSCKSLSNSSLNSILKMCQKGIGISDKTLKYLEVPTAKANICSTLSNYNDFTNAGWSIGY